MADRPKARLTQAFAWVCDSCGRNNFAGAVAVEGAAREDLDAALREQLGLADFEPIPDGHSGEFVIAPTTVRCAHCGEQFETEDDKEASE